MPYALTKLIIFLSGITLFTFSTFPIGRLVILQPGQPATTTIMTTVIKPPQKISAVPKPVIARPPTATKLPKLPVNSTPSAPTPAPATAIANAPISLTGILNATNAERVNVGLLPLANNSRLNIVATKRLDDMFTNQYFSHDAPDGTTYVDLIENVGYPYSRIGENIALGDFSTSAGIVTAWMNSPGHRANMLNGNYTEIGVAVAKRHFVDHDQWIAVQIFGTPR